MVSPFRFIKDKTISAFDSQHFTLSLLIDKAIELCNDKSVYDIDSISYDYLGRLTTTLFHNLLFYLELFAKAYLTISNVRFPYRHNLSELHRLVKKTMFDLHQNDTLFHGYIFPTFEKFTNYVSNIDQFEEHFVKYNDNKKDFTVIDFGQIQELKDFIDMSYDFIGLYCFDRKDDLYLKPGLLSSLLDRCETTEEKDQIQSLYLFLTDYNSPCF